MGLAIDLKSSNQSSSGASGRSGDVSSYFASGDFTTGGGKSLTWIFVVAGVVLVAMFYFRGKQ